MVTGIIAEFDPFHNGHEYLIKEAKKDGDLVLVVLSGNLTQRGLPSFLPKKERAMLAIKAGADLVIELPSFFSLTSAEGFARAGVSLLKDAGADAIFFGREAKNTGELELAAQTENDLREQIKALTKTGIGYPAAREIALKEAGKEALIPIFSNGNDILGVEYIKAKNAIFPNLQLKTVKRTTGRDAISGEFSPASFIRKAPLESEKYMPNYSFETVLNSIKNGTAAEVNRAEKEIIYFLRTVSAESIKNANDIKEGLEFRLKSAAEKAKNYQELIEFAASKRYTDSRLKRAVLSAFLGREKTLKTLLPPYIRVLAMNKNGAELLRKIPNNKTVITKSANGKRLSGFAKTVFDYEVKASEFRNLCTEKFAEFGEEYKFIPYVEK